MRKWYKFSLDAGRQGKIFIPMDNTYDEHKRAMGGYSADNAYRSEPEFFNKYFFNYQLHRLEYYDRFLRKHLKKEDKVLSVASGRCANELYLLQGGHRITCSDLDTFDAIQATKALFPEFEYIKLNILTGASDKKYDAILCLSLIYLFDESDLLRFFKNVSDSLNKNGYLILDSAGPCDNLLSYMIHDLLLKYETILVRFVKFFLTGKLNGIIRQHFGYRRTDKEIIESAKKFGLELVCQENYAFLSEFKRSRIFNLIIKENSIMEKIFSVIGRNIPYIRMFKFKK